jgi:hypothetical protein
MNVMKQKVFFLLLAVCFSLNLMAAKEERFIFIDSQGNEYSCCILSQVEKTVSITTSGNTMNMEVVTIPQTIDISGVDYTVTAISPGFSLILKKIVLPPTIREIENNAFAWCKSLESINLPEGLVSIGKKAFYGCTKLKSLYVPNSVRSIGMLCFWGTIKPLDIYFENLPPFVNTSNCPDMGITKKKFNSYLAQHPVSSQPQVVYVQQPATAQTTPQPTAADKPKVPSSDVDVDIPTTKDENENMFAVIIANENYQEEVKVDYALNDGEMFKTYCNKVLGIPEKNIHIRKDATRNNMIAEMSWLQQVSKAYNGDARFVVYYAGHGIPDEKSGTSYLLPVDGKGSMLETGYSLQKFYKELGDMPSSGVTIFMDACFSGSKRGDGMLAAARGVAIKAKPQAPQGKMVVFSAAQGDETAYPYKDKGHGLFTYYLLKKLKETKGNVSLEELSSYITEKVSRESIVSNGKSQTPSISASQAIANEWKSIKLK